MSPFTRARFPRADATRISSRDELAATIRIGVVLDSPEVPAWQYHLLLQLRQSDYAAIELLLFDDPAEDRRRTAGTGSLFRAFQRREAARDSVSPDACEIKDISGIFGDPGRLGLPPELSGGERDANIRSRSLDLLLVLGQAPDLERFAGLAVHGAWYFRHSYCGRCATGSTVGFWEVIRRRPYIHSTLNMVRPNEPERVVYQSFSSVRRLSHLRSRNEVLWKIPSFALRAVRELATKGELARSFAMDSAAEQPAARKPLTNLHLLPPMLVYVLWRLWLRLQRIFYTERWILMFMRGPEDREDMLDDYEKLIPPEGRFWADPHAIERDGRTYVFFEDATLASGHGHLAVLGLRPDARPSEAIPILKRPYHLSYPFLLEWNGELYLIPETAERRTIEAWRCRKFPEEWEFSHILMEGVDAFDATLFEDNGTWWMFVNMREHEGASTWDELCLFHADTPLATTWHPHPMNPVISDVRKARPAGPLFRVGSRMFRPSQNSSFCYGYGLNINEITELTKTNYRETRARQIVPPRGSAVRSMHSYCRVGDLTVIDAVYRSRRTRGGVSRSS